MIERTVRFAHQAVVFCEHIKDFWCTKALLEAFVKKLNEEHLVELTRVKFVKFPMARKLFRGKKKLKIK